MKLATDIGVPHVMNWNKFNNLLTFHIFLSSGQAFNLSKTLFYEQIPSNDIHHPQLLHTFLVMFYLYC